MIKWSLSAETLAFILIIIIAVFSYDRKRLSTRIEKLFNTALIMTAASILLNFACIFSIEHYDKVPRTWNVMINSAYFLVSVTMCTMMAAYFFELILQHVYRKNCRVRSTVGLIVLMTAYTLLLIANLWTGWIFSFDSQGQYQRGILNKSGYVILLAELVMVGLCYKNNRQSVEKRVVKVLRLLPFIVLLLVVLQFLFPELLLNGTMVVFVMVSSLISFRSPEKEAAGLPESVTAGVSMRN